MKLPSLVERALQHGPVNFWLTNRIPRRRLTRFVGWFSRIEQPLVRDLSIALFETFAGDLRLFEARKAAFRSLHDCFIRELRDGARPVDHDADVLVSPCDAIVGAFGSILGGELLQIKGSRYSLAELLTDPAAAARYRDGTYVTLRLTSNMYHRFHAPCDCRVGAVCRIPGDLWNVNQAALARVPRLYCRNERVAIELETASRRNVTLVAVGAVLVGSVHLSFADQTAGAGGGDRRIGKGEELGYFHHGSTIVVLASRPIGLCDHLRAGMTVRMGEPLLRLPRTAPLP